MLIIKNVLQSVVEQRVCQTVWTEKFVFFHLVALLFGLSLILTKGLFPFFLLFGCQVQEELTTTTVDTFIDIRDDRMHDG